MSNNQRFVVIVKQLKPVRTTVNCCCIVGKVFHVSADVRIQTPLNLLMQSDGFVLVT